MNNLNFNHYKFYVDNLGIIIGRPVNPYKLYPDWSESVFLNSMYYEFESKMLELTFYCTDEIKPGIYDKNDILVMHMYFSPHEFKKYFSYRQIPVIRYPSDKYPGSYYAMIYSLKHDPASQRKCVEIKNEN